MEKPKIYLETTMFSFYYGQETTPNIARPWTIERVRRMNFREAYKPIGIYKPSEVLEL
jgi:hypothetical protein